MSKKGKAESAFLQSQSLILAGNYDEAERLLLHSLRLPTRKTWRTLLLSALAEVYRKLDQVQRETDCVLQAEATLPEDIGKKISTAWHYLLRRGDLEEAEKKVNEALSIDANDSFVIHQTQQILGEIAFLRGNIDQASWHLKKSLDIDEPGKLFLGPEFNLMERLSGIKSRRDVCSDYARKILNTDCWKDYLKNHLKYPLLQDLALERMENDQLL